MVKVCLKIHICPIIRYGGSTVIVNKDGAVMLNQRPINRALENYFFRTNVEELHVIYRKRLYAGNRGKGFSTTSPAAYRNIN
jgi:hypothetical protein